MSIFNSNIRDDLYNKIEELQTEIDELNALGAKEALNAMREVESLREQNKKMRECLDAVKEFYPRFWSKVDVKKKNECWEWKSSMSPNGYGKFSFNNYPHSAHILAFKYINGDYDKDLWIDHICKNRKCVNPNHLRAVTPRINAIENSVSTSAQNYQKSHCKHGHEFTSENTRIKKVKDRTTRVCKICYAKQCRERRKRARALLTELGNDN